MNVSPTLSPSAPSVQAFAMHATRCGYRDVDTAHFVIVADVAYVTYKDRTWAAMSVDAARATAKELFARGYRKCASPLVVLGLARIEAHTCRESFGWTARLDEDVQVAAQWAPVIANRTGAGTFQGGTILAQSTRASGEQHTLCMSRYCYELARMACEGTFKLTHTGCTVAVEDNDLSDVAPALRRYSPAQRYTFTYAAA